MMRAALPARRGTALAAVVAGWLLLGAALPAQARTLAEIRQSGELRICVAGSSAAFYQVNGEEFARSLGVHVTSTVLASWDQQFQNAQGVTVIDAAYEPALLANGQCDLYPNDLHMTPWRMKMMGLVPYFQTRNVVVARPELRSVLRQPEDLGGRVAAVQAGTAYEAWLNGFNAAQPEGRAVVIHTAPTAQSMRRVAERRADFTLIAAESAFRWVRDDLQNLDLLFTVGETVDVGWGTSRNAADLRDALQQYFVAGRRIGSRLDLSWRKNYGVSLAEYQLFSASFDTHAQLRAVWAQWGVPLVSAVGGVMLAMLFWAWRLHREAARHRLDAQVLRESQAAMAHEALRRKAVSELLLALQQAGTLQEFSQAVLRELARHLPLGQALFALVHPALGAVAQAHYAGSGATPAQTLGEFPSTAGLLERCMATGELVLVEQPGDGYLRIRSGLGSGAPAAILVLPVMRAAAVVAVIELALSQPFTADHRLLLEELSQIVAASLERFQRPPPASDA
jgi:hypothetical protein